MGRVSSPLSSIEDMERVLEGIPVGKASINLLSASSVGIVILAQHLAVAERRGVKPHELRGTLTHDCFMAHCCYAQESNPLDMGLRLNADIIEYCARSMPLWNTIYIGVCYNLREADTLPAVHKVAFGLAAALEFIRVCLERRFRTSCRCLLLGRD